MYWPFGSLSTRLLFVFRWNPTKYSNSQFADVCTEGLTALHSLTTSPRSKIHERKQSLRRYPKITKLNLYKARLYLGFGAGSAPDDTSHWFYPFRIHESYWQLISELWNSSLMLIESQAFWMTSLTPCLSTIALMCYLLCSTNVCCATACKQKGPCPLKFSYLSNRETYKCLKV